MNEERPVFTWLSVEPSTGPDGTFMDFLAEPGLPAMPLNSAGGAIHFSDNNRVLKRPHEPIAWVVHLGPTGNDGLKYVGGPNQSFARIDQELPDAMHGPFVMYGPGYHLDMMSFRHIVDDLRADYYKAQYMKEKNATGPIKGVRVSCGGDLLISHRPQFEQVNLDSSFFDLDRTINLPVGDKIGIPLEARMIPEALPWRNRHHLGDWAKRYAQNEFAQRLNPAQWWPLTGSIVIARKDKKLLHCAHVDALSEYCAREGYSIAQLRNLPAGPHSHLPDDALVPIEYLRSLMNQNYQASSQQLLSRASEQGFKDFNLDFMRNGGIEKYGYVTSPYII